MKYTPIYEIIEQIKEDHEINFIGVAVTPWHACGVDCAIEYLNERQVSLKGIILISRHASGGTLISDKNFINTNKGQFVFANIQYEKRGKRDNYLFNTMQEIRYLVGKENKKGRVIYFANPWKPNIGLSANICENITDCRIVHIICDEGLSTYMGAPKFIDKGNPLRVLHSLFNILRSYQIEILYLKLTLKFHEAVKLTLLNKKHNDVFLNSLAVSLYSKVLCRQETPINEELLKQINGNVLICTQPYYDNGEVFQDDDIRTLKLVCDMYKLLGFKVFLKPHPRDKSVKRYSKTGAIILENLNCSLESIFFNTQELLPAFVVGFTSTALVTANIFKNICAVSLTYLIQEKNYKSNVLYDQKKFRKIFSKFVNLPKNENELKNLIQLQCERGVADNGS